MSLWTAQVHGSLLQARLLLETNAASATATERTDLIDKTAATMLARRQLMRAGAGIPAVICTEFLRTAAALVDAILKPLPPYAVSVSQIERRKTGEAWEDQAAAAGRLQLPEDLPVSSPAIAAFAAAVLECCREAVVSSPDASSTDAADPMRSLYLKEAALLYFGPSLDAVLRRQRATEAHGAGAIPHPAPILMQRKDFDIVLIMVLSQS